MDKYQEMSTKMKAIGSKPIIAKIGGFRPNADEKSWFGGNFLNNDDAPWVSDNDGNMLPIVQIYVPDVVNGREIFGDVELIQVFISKDSLPVGEAKNGDGWLIKEYKNIENMVTYPTPEDVATLIKFPIRWELHEEHDYPCWEEAWDYVDLEYVNESKELREKFFEEFSSYGRTKIGGYASYIQSPISAEFKYVFQISSEEKPKFYVADAGNMYFYKSCDTNEWYMHWDCY